MTDLFLLRQPLLRTSHTGGSEAEVARTYWRLTDIERTFQTIKSKLVLRPPYHDTNDRIAGHLFISVLACHAIRPIRPQLRMRSIPQSRSALWFVLSRWQRITTRLPQSQDRCIRVTRDVDLTPFQRFIASVMGINPTGFAKNPKKIGPQECRRV